MQLEKGLLKERETPIDSVKPTPIVKLDFNRPVKQIAELLEDPGFPQCALGEFVDIGDYSGVVVQIVKQSMKVRSQEGVTRSFNPSGLRKLYGPRPEPTPLPEAATDEAAQTPPAREIITEPNFNQPLALIAALAADPNFPQCAFGKLIDFGGFTGVVTEIVNGSIKVRSREEATRSYNIQRVRELHGKQRRPAATR